MTSNIEGPGSKRLELSQQIGGMFARAASGAEGLSKSVLGTLALFLLLVYFIGSFTLVVAHLDSQNQQMLVGFIVFFPVLVLGVFYVLVTRHFGKVVNPDKVDSKTYAEIVLANARVVDLEAVQTEAAREERERKKLASAIANTSDADEKEILNKVMDWFSPRMRQKRFVFKRAAEQLSGHPELVFADFKTSSDIMGVFNYLDEICEAVTSGVLDERRIPGHFRQSAVRYFKRGEHWIEFLRAKTNDGNRFKCFENIASNTSTKWQNDPRAPIHPKTTAPAPTVKIVADN